MDTQAVERIRARRKQQIEAIGTLGGELLEVLTGKRNSPSELAQAMADSAWTGIDIDILLCIIDRQQAVIQAAKVVTSYREWIGTGEYLVEHHALDALHDALAALEGADDGDGA